ncbi:hypothetical protein GYMLUDRAFT_692821 [Collybiopsis luxurians FD-317 M1]|uniref:Uncharacterized protein n=1 Tax=Collybiopsis luxurians FD-317 M1 TaxID=944289 RepID=A0A0D0CJM5_9AGAR|nr:hypothetical protein GYMLUDRAFT_692821 [Collybiopsis luxurians FD-317 M1]
MAELIAFSEAARNGNVLNDSWSEFFPLGITQSIYLLSLSSLTKIATKTLYRSNIWNYAIEEQSYPNPIADKNENATQKSVSDDSEFHDLLKWAFNQLEAQNGPSSQSDGQASLLDSRVDTDQSNNDVSQSIHTSETKAAILSDSGSTPGLTTGSSTSPENSSLPTPPYINDGIPQALSCAFNQFEGSHESCLHPSGSSNTLSLLSHDERSRSRGRRSPTLWLKRMG